jgi:hypothetical protein
MSNYSEFSLKLSIQHISGNMLEGDLRAFRVDERTCRWIFEFTSLVTPKMTFNNSDMFECLIDLRIELKKYSYIPLCNGARLDTYPATGMCRDMAEGGAVFILKIGQPLDFDNVVNIFDYAEPQLIASVEEQLNFFESWLYPNGKYTPDQKELQIQHSGGGIIKGKLLIYERLKHCKIEFISSQTPIFECIQTNFFECLVDLRRKLERLEYRVLCNGARLDTYIFRKMIQMCRGDRTHVLKHGCIPEDEDKLLIFKYAAPHLIASVEEQRKYYESWLESVKSLPKSEYTVYGWSYFSDIYLRLIKIGDLPLMWLFDIDDEEDIYLKALSPLSPEEVNQIGELKSEAIIGLFHNGNSRIEDFRPNKVFLDFMHKIISTEAVEDPSIMEAAMQQKEGWLYIIDNRVSSIANDDTDSEDIIGAFEVVDGKITSDSYYPNPNYSVLGENGLFQLPDSLYKLLIEAIKSI